MTDPPRSETYLDIVWRQFKGNRLAYGSLWVIVPIFLTAIAAPLLASDQPFIFFTDTETIFPWIHAVLNPEETVDLAFNVALLALPPAALLGGVANLRWRILGWRARQRWAYLTAGYLLLAALGLAVVLVPEALAEHDPDTFGNWRVRPANKYRQRSFTTEQFNTDGRHYGIYPPIPFGPREQDMASVFKGPLYRKDPSRWTKANDRMWRFFGTDNVGRDVLVQMIYGTRISMTIGFLAVGLYVTIGSVLGAVAGYFGGMIDVLVSRAIEVMLLFPAFFLILTLVGMIGPSIYIIMVVIGVTGWPTVARLIRGEVLKQRAQDYVVAARAMGMSPARVIFRHVLPNSLSPALVAAPFGVASAIVTEAGLSLLGFGVRPPTPSWGTLLKHGSENYHYWWLVLIPSIAIFVTVTLFNTIGSGLRDAMDPRLREAR